MPRPRPRRPPGAGSALTTLALLFIVGLVAAQQQQSFEHDVHNRPPPRVEKAHIIPPHHGKPHLKETVGDADTRRPYTPLLSQNARAVATKVPSAPAISAVRAHPARYAASGGLVPSARSLHDWEVEDFVLLATIDGHIHARDRYNGEEIWELSGKPMLETIYNTSTGKTSPQDQPFVWIVEPREDGALYLLQPGPHPVLTHLGVTVKQLAESAPYSSDDPELPVVYNVEKKTFMLLVEAASGIVKQSFSPGGPTLDDSCAPDSKNFFSARERDCRGVIDIGQTQYTITIHNKKTNEHICTIKYAEWNPNSRDKDLQSQYDQTLDKQYIYTLYSGEVIAFDYKRPRSHQRPLYRQRLPYPVARVFDVARPLNDPTDEPPLVLLPQPAGPAFTEDRYNHVLLNRTETGAWYALSEVNYPAVTDGAPDATCYKLSETVSDWDAQYAFPDVKTLVGVHKLDYIHPMPKTQLPGIAAPTYYDPVNDRVISNPPETSPRERQQPPTIDAPPQLHTDARYFTSLVFSLLLVLVVVFGLQARPKVVESWKNYLMGLWPSGKARHPLPPVPAPVEPKTEQKDEDVLQLPNAEVDVSQQLVVETVEKAEVTVPVPVLEEAKEKKVTFDIPDDEEDLAPLSRATTVDRDSPVEDEGGNIEVTSNGDALMTNSTDDLSQDTSASPATPKKKKTHRGKRGGRKLSKNQKEEELNRIVDAAKQLEVRPRLQPDELTETGGDVQAVTEIKRIGKLTIDQDRLLGNGSGGTFVFEGKWKVRHIRASSAGR
jgi:serine/threonine-protein kinase/endoribonuclease IRE1